MATEVRAFQAVIPARTPISAPVTVDASFPSMEVERLHITVPPGSAGLMGFRLVSGVSQVIPLNLGAWLILEADSVEWAMTGLPNGGRWSITGYNTDIYDHTVYVYFLLSPVGAQQSSQVASQAAAGAAVSDVLSMTGTVTT